jgi:hypothetical protein
VKDGAHTHGHGGGLGAALAIGAGAMLAIGAAEAIARVLPYVLAGAAVITGLWAAGWITRVVLAYRYQQAAWHAEVTGTARADVRDREIAALRQAMPTCTPGSPPARTPANVRAWNVTSTCTSTAWPPSRSPRCWPPGSKIEVVSGDRNPDDGYDDHQGYQGRPDGHAAGR